MFGLDDGVMDARLKDSDDEDDDEEERPARIHYKMPAEVPCDTH
jgi:hypothetical protein